MNRISARSHPTSLILLVGAVLLLAPAAPGAQRPDDPRFQPRLEQKHATAAQQLYPDAPDGVDPVVTGPVSREFRARQKSARCDEARWPNIPVECYP
jgi:hypothetical protein